jgi:hypothetical protein
MDKIESAAFIELKYRERIDALTPMERMARASSIFQWTREAIARQIVADSGPMSSERLKWLAAMRLYGTEANPATILFFLSNIGSNQIREIL